ncbi:MAG: class I SAM-dependent methyltransferase [Lachnospiraceae bacterium]|nr:class I SAM-dependent methyltransferase [Lachnospiraceae bacterium]
MIEKVGQVILNYEFYKGEDLYSDGEIEDWLLQFAREGLVEQALQSNKVWPVFYHFTPIRQHILEWYPMKQGASVLEIGSGCGAITGVLSRMAKRVVCIELSKKRSLINAYRNQDCENVEIMVGNYEDIQLEERFDYITLVGVLEYAEYYTHSEKPARDMLRQLKAMLKPDGKILIAIENRMGLKYLNGACEDHTGGLFDGLYQYHGEKGVRTYTKWELEHLLADAGYAGQKFYYPLPDYKLPRLILSDESHLAAGCMQGMTISYDRDRYVFFDEDMVWDTLCRDGELGYWSNSLFVEAGLEQAALSTVESVFYSYANRSRKRIIRTMILNRASGKTVVKSALYPEGKEHLDSLLYHYERMSNLYKNVNVVPPVRAGESIEFAFIEGAKLQDLLLQDACDKEKTRQRVLSFMDRILDFNEEYLTEFKLTDDFANVFGETNMDGEPAVSVANIDCIFSNFVERGGELYCFDYEWVFFFPVPISFIRYRMLKSWYADVRGYLPYEEVNDFFEDYGITSDLLAKLDNMERHFLEYVQDGEPGYEYTAQYMKNEISIDDITDIINTMTENNAQLTEEKEVLQGRVDALEEQLKITEKKLDMHLQNEARLRRRLEQR